MTARSLLKLGLPGLLAVASCSDDPVAPSADRQRDGGYDVTIELYEGSVQGICGRSDGEVYAAGDLLARWDGSSWRPLSLPPGVGSLNAIWIGADGSFYVQEWQRIWRYNGAAWDYVTPPAYSSGMCVTSDGNIFTVSDAGFVHRFDGSSWESDSLTSNYLRGVSGTRSDDVFVSGENGFIAHYDGSAWTPMPTDTLVSLENTWRFGDGPLYTMSTSGRIYRVNGTTLSRLNPGADFRAEYLWPSGTSGFCAAGRAFEPEYHGAVYRYDGTTWTEVLTAGDSFRGGWTSPDGTIFAAENNAVWRHTGSGSDIVLGESLVHSGSGYPYMSLGSLWTTPEGDIIAIGGSALRHDGDGWVDLHKEWLTNQFAYAIHGRSSNDFYAVGDRMILHYDGNDWDWVSSGFQSRLSSVWANGNEVIATGEEGRIVRLKSGEWQLMESGTPAPLWAVSGWDGGAYAVGAGGTLLRYDGARWLPEKSPTTQELNNVVAFEMGRAIAIGSDPAVIYVCDSRSWKTVPIPLGNQNEFNSAIYARSPRDVFIGGDGGLIHYDGRDWSVISRNLTYGTSSVTGTPDGELLVSGNGTLLRYRPR